MFITKSSSQESSQINAAVSSENPAALTSDDDDREEPPTSAGDPPSQPPHSDGSDSSDEPPVFPEPKRPRFGFFKSDSDEEYEFVDEDMFYSRAIIARDWDKVQLDIDKLRLEEEGIDVEGTNDSASDSSDYYRDTDFWSGCYMAKMKRHMKIEEKREQINEAMRYCLDGMANVNVIRNPNVLHNIRDSGKVMKIVGIGGKQIEITKVGDHRLFGKCWYYPQNEFNIISQWKANEQGLMFRVSEDNEQAWLVREDVNICFIRDPKDHFYKCPIEDVDKLILALDKRKEETGKSYPMYGEDFVGNIDEIYGNGKQNMLYTDEQVRRAEIAEALHITMEHCSDQQLKAFIESPSTINCPITFNDVRNLRVIKGPCLVCLEGKPKPHKGSHSSNDPDVPQHAGELLHCDIVFVKGRPRLFTIDHVSGYCSFIVMPDKSVPSLEKAFEEILNAYQSYLKVVLYF